MIGRHVTDRLAALADNQLAPADAERTTAHLAACERCRRARDAYRFAAGLLGGLERVQAPPLVWPAIQAERAGSAAPMSKGSWSWRLAYLAMVLATFALAGWWSRTTQPQPWEVLRADVGNARVAPGEWIDTTNGASARLTIGEIGTVLIDAGSRMQLLSARPDQQRLSLAHGRISAEIVAPPRIFLVETPAGTIVDLGCAYTMEVDQDGTGTLRVTGGWVALEWGIRQSLVPAGASALTRAGSAPGTPSFDDASARLRGALLEFDFGASGGSALDVILSEARDRDTLTLWHLMSRVSLVDRARVFDRIVALTPLPVGVDRRSVMALEADAMTRWREELAWTW